MGMENAFAAAAAELFELTATLPEKLSSADAENTTLYERLAVIGSDLPRITDTPAAAILKSQSQGNEGSEEQSGGSGAAVAAAVTTAAPKAAPVAAPVAVAAEAKKEEEKEEEKEKEKDL